MPLYSNEFSTSNDYKEDEIRNPYLVATKKDEKKILNDLYSLLNSYSNYFNDIFICFCKSF